MNTVELFQFISTKVKNFTNLEIIYNGVAYHYTMHSNFIEASGRYLGVAISEEIDRTQDGVESIPAKEIDGVVFAYEELEASKEEGFLLKEDKKKNKIYEITFRTAIRANHQQEVDFSGAPLTIIIIASEIIDFKIVYPNTEL